MPQPPWSRRTGLALGATLAGALLGAHAFPTSAAQLTDSQVVAGNVVQTKTACAGGASYPAVTLSKNPSFYWRISEATPPAVTTVNDSSSNNADGTSTGTGRTFGPTNAGLIQCDTTYSVRFRGQAADNGFLVQPTAVPNPDTFTISAWVRSNSNRGGWILGMGSARWGTSVNRDRVLYLQRNGRPAFAVGIGPRTILQGTTTINDNAPHMLVGTVGPGGAALYVDGARVDFDPTVTSGATYTGNEAADPSPPGVPPTPNGFGYWRVGYDSTAGLGPSVPTRNQIAARVDEIAVWQNDALTASEVADLFSRDHW